MSKENAKHINEPRSFQIKAGSVVRSSMHPYPGHLIQELNVGTVGIIIIIIDNNNNNNNNDANNNNNNNSYNNNNNDDDNNCILHHLQGDKQIQIQQ